MFALMHHIYTGAKSSFSKFEFEICGFHALVFDQSYLLIVVGHEEQDRVDGSKGEEKQEAQFW